MLRLSLSFGLGGGEKERIHNNCIQSLHVTLKSEKFQQCIAIDKR